jgi:hypothetical protein
VRSAARQRVAHPANRVHQDLNVGGTGGGEIQRDMIVGGEGSVTSSGAGHQRLKLLGAHQQGQRTAVLHPFDIGSVLGRAGKRLVARKRKRGDIFPRSIIPAGGERRDRQHAADFQRWIGVAEGGGMKWRSS